MRIVKVKWGKRDEFEAIPGFVYCGRAWGGFLQSPLGNPFRPMPGTDALERYRDWLKAKLSDRTPGTRHVRDFFATLTNDSVLGCWCCDKDKAGTEPLQCHCDVIAKIFEARR